MGRKSASVPSNLASLCGNTHHVLKTEAGRVWRPVILEWLARFEEPIEPLRPDLLISSKGVSK